MGFRQKTRRVTAFDVAELAGVSQSTVSRVLSGSGTASRDVIARVEAAATKLGYFVNERAARLRKGRTDTIAVVILEDKPEIRESNDLSCTVSLGWICQACAQMGLDTLVSMQSKIAVYFWWYYQQGKADGTILVGDFSNAPPSYFVNLQAKGEPMVLWDTSRMTADCGLSASGSDRPVGIDRLIEQLID